MNEQVETAMATLQETVRKLIDAKVEAALARLTKDCADVVAAAVAALPVPKDGERGADAVVDYEQIKAMIPAPIPGKDAEVDYTKIWAGCSDLIRQQIAELPKAKDGESVEPETVQAMVDSAVKALPQAKDGVDGISGKDGQDGQDGKDGADGRDALEIDIIPEINPARVYRPGTFARHRGGLVRAKRSTSPVKAGNITEAGWETIVEGIAHAEVAQDDDLRTFAVGFELTSGATFLQKFALPALIYRELYQAEANYKTGDVVTWGGSMYVALADTTDAPGRSESWRLAVKHGRDGKDFDPTPPRKPEPLRLR